MTNPDSPPRECLKADSVVAWNGAAPAILGAEDKAGTKPVILGSGAHTYECHHHWGELPESIRWRNTHGVAVDAAGFIYVTHQGIDQSPVDTVVVFDPAGKFVRSFGREYAGGGHGIDIREEGGRSSYTCATRSIARL